MFLYISTSTSYKIYNDLFSKDLIAGGYQSQKFNSNIITGLSNYANIVSLSALPYIKVDNERIELVDKNVKYICIKNSSGVLHKINNVKELIKEGKKIIKNQKPEFIICDAFSFSPAIAALHLSRKYKIPAVAIVTDLHEASCNGNISTLGKIHAKLMKKFDLYVLLTKQMNDIINPGNKPFVVMEGSCNVEDDFSSDNIDDEKALVCLYGGALWKDNAGLEYFIDGFIKAAIPNSELHFYGSGELIPYIERLSEKYPQIKYKGIVTNNELLSKQREASLLINPRPSSCEFCKYSFPSKTFEYMISGTPVLMTKLPGIPDEYFDCVYTIDVENSDFVSEKLTEIFSLTKEERLRKATLAKDFILTKKNNIVQSKIIYDFLSNN